MVNITDIDDSKVPQNVDMLEEMFKRQEELRQKYHSIEQKANFHTTVGYPLHIDDKNGQALLKDFAWRVTEELGEATMAYREKGNCKHTQEEVADAFHFLIELNIWAGIDHISFYEKITNGRSLLKPKKYCRLQFCYDWADDARPPIHMNRNLFMAYCFQVVEYLAEAMNTLKQKPWKQTAMLTDKKVFLKALTNANISFFTLCKFLGMGPKDLHSMYFKKSEVNKFRIKSKY